MGAPIKILMAEDNPADSELILLALRRAGFQPDWKRVETEKDFLDHLDANIQLIISDFAMPQFNGMRALELSREKHPEVPFILISGTIGEEAAVEAIKHGASDYLLKDRLARLGPAVKKALKQRRLDVERTALEEQFRQSQKMEAIGQLSGGVAHDFNNILTVIHMHASILQYDETLSERVRESARQIGEASERAANLTRQLLMFSRRQNLQLCDLSLNEIVTNIAKMLQRILGEDIRMELRFSPQPLVVEGDAGMMDQVLLNLVVNSRDAMPEGGSLVIETSAVEIDCVRAASTPKAREGSFACLSVKDTGAGIPPELVSRIFEPFFTTKEPGKGTGLGLATIYGIVEQHRGWIEVDTGKGQGTTFRIYLPRQSLPMQKKTAQSDNDFSPRGTETVLVVEDDATLRLLVLEVLGGLGYRLFEASTGPEALYIWSRHRSEIDLVLTDLIMPNGMSGVGLVRQLVAERPDLKVVYTSGYSPEMAARNLQLKEGVNFIAKPYYPNKLAQTIRAGLDA